MKFEELKLDQSLLEGISALGFEETSPIQTEAIPLALEGKDLIACAQTGTGKTAAYLIPTINKLVQEPSDHSRVLIIAPTRELVQQIDQNVEALSYFTGVSSVPIVGGGKSEAFDRQKYGLENGADIIVATPGRLKIHLTLGYLSFKHIHTVILDEADKMLDMGFFQDIIHIISHVPKERQTLMFSATMPKKIRELALRILKDPDEINLNLSKPAEGIDQRAFSVFNEQKIPLLGKILQNEEVESMIIFASSKLSVDEIARKLKRLKFDVEAIHSDKTQEDREICLRRFKNKEFPILVGTDVLARGIDIDNLSHVLNFDVPHDAEDYVHRVGRTARASATGKAITFINPKDQRRMAGIERLIEMEIPKPAVPEELGETPEYNPRRGGRGGGGPRRGGGDRRRGGNNRGGNNRGRNHNPRNRRGNRRNGSGNRRNQEGEGNSNGSNPQNGSSNNKRRRNRRRPNRPPQNEAQSS